MNTQPKVLFMGTPDFAVPSLEALNWHKLSGLIDIACVVTSKDQKVGRSQELEKTPVKRKAEIYNLPILEIESLQDPKTQEEILAYEPDLIVVTAFGYILPKHIIEYPKYGTYNVHGSLLPRHRGASPIQAAILAGDAMSGVTLQRMVPKLDAGDVIGERRYPMGHDTTQYLMTIFARMGKDLLLTEIPNILEGKEVLQKQDESQVTVCKKIKKEDAHMDPKTKTADELEREVRAFFPWPISYFMHNDKRVQLQKALLSNTEIPKDKKPGDIFESQKRPIMVCKENTGLVLEELKVEGTKNSISGKQFVNTQL